MNPSRTLQSLRPASFTVILILCASVWTRIASAAPLVPIGPEFQVNTYTTSGGSFPEVALAPDGTFIIVWNSDASFGSDQSEGSIQARRFDSDGSPLEREFQVNAYTYDEQRHQSVALLPDGGFVVAWTNFGQATNDPSFSIEARRFAADGTPQGGEFQVNTTTQWLQALPSVAADSNGNFVVTWSSAYSAGNDPSWSIQLQRFASDATPLGGELQVNTFTRGYQGNSAMAMAANGNFVVVWESHPDGHPASVLGQRFDSSANRLGSEFRVNTSTLFNRKQPSVAADAAGNFVVVWLDEGYSGGIHGQRFASDGTRRGTEFQASAASFYQDHPSVAADGQGNFLVVWGGLLGPPSPPQPRVEAISAQQFDTAGMRVGSEFQIASSAEHRPSFPFVAANSRGDFVVSWISNYQGIVARRFGVAPPSPTPTTTPTPRPTSTPTPTPTPLSPGDLSFLGPHSVVEGMQLQVPLIFHSGTHPLGAYLVTVTVDSEVLELVTVENGTSRQFTAAPVFKSQPGQVTISGLNDTSLSLPDGEVNVATLVVKGKAPGGSSLAVTAEKILDTQRSAFTDVEPIEGQVNVLPPLAALGIAALLVLSLLILRFGGRRQVRFGQGGVLVGLALLVTSFATSGSRGTGDVNGDGNVTSEDARLVQSALVGLAELEPAQRVAADVDASGTVGLEDALAIAQVAAGLVEPFPTPTPTSIAAPTEIVREATRAAGGR